MTNEQRKEATIAVYDWLVEYKGEELAQFWMWERTPLPCGLPLDRQLEEGMMMALGHVPEDLRR